MTCPREVDDLYRQLVEIEARREAAAAAMQAAETAGDDDAWDRAAAAYDDCGDELGPVKARIWEIEEDAGWDEWRDLRRNSPIVL